MSAEQPMTAAKILDDLLSPRGDELWSERVYHILVRMLEWMEARERRDADLEEMKRQIGEMGQRVREGKR